MFQSVISKNENREVRENNFLYIFSMEFIYSIVIALKSYNIQAIIYCY